MLYVCNSTVSVHNLFECNRESDQLDAYETEPTSNNEEYTKSTAPSIDSDTSGLFEKESSSSRDVNLATILDVEQSRSSAKDVSVETPKTNGRANRPSTSVWIKPLGTDENDEIKNNTVPNAIDLSRPPRYRLGSAGTRTPRFYHFSSP